MKKRLTLRIYRDKKRQFRWTLIASNGRKLANGGEGYKRVSDLERAIFVTLLGDQFPSGKNPLDCVTNFRADMKVESTAHREAK